MIYSIVGLNILASDSQILRLRDDAIDLNKKVRAKRYNKCSIFNLQFSIPACPGWVLFVISYSELELTENLISQLCQQWRIQTDFLYFKPLTISEEPITDNPHNCDD